jgi:ABC-type phosphate transport system substrate-binding protein
MVSRKLALASALAGACAVAAPGIAGAAPCADLPNPVYISGSTAVQPFVVSISKVLAGKTTLVYQSAGSCVGVTSVVNDKTPTGACTADACIRSTAVYFDASGNSSNCDLPEGGQHVDVGISDVFATSCDGVSTLPSTIKDATGPVQAMLFVVPKASNETAITAEEGYLAFGFGGAPGMAKPWLDLASLIIRNTGSGTQQMIARAIGMAAGQMKGTDSKGSGNIEPLVNARPDKQAAIGILAADVFDTKARDKLNPLAFRAFHQWNAYYADSTSTALDKKNVRDGHYFIWGPMHMVIQVNAGDGKPLSTGAKLFVDWVQGNPTDPVAPFDITDITIESNMIPVCSMTVKREVEMGPLSRFSPEAPCGCYYESKKGGTKCAKCEGTGQSTCATGQQCRRGFCESH